MARPLRIEYPGAFYHVMHRGNASIDIFKSNSDREKFLTSLGKAAARYAIKIHAYCLMPNHYHLLIETPEANLSQSIKWINVSYATYFNRKRNRSGHLFQGRYKAIIVHADEYIKQLSRYIHLNPARAQIVAHVKDYPWSSYPAYSGRAKTPEWLETDWLLPLFGQNAENAKARYRNFVEATPVDEIGNPERKLVSGCILGDQKFVEWIKHNHLKLKADNREIPHQKKLSHSIDTENIVSIVCEAFQCRPESIRQKGKKGNLARDIAIFLCREHSAETGVSLGQFFGGISGAGITLRVHKIHNLIRQDDTLKQCISNLKKRILEHTLDTHPNHNPRWRNFAEYG